MARSRITLVVGVAAVVVAVVSGCFSSQVSPPSPSTTMPPATASPPAMPTAAVPSTQRLTSFALADGALVVLDQVPTAEHPHMNIEVLTGGVVVTTPGGCWGFEDGRGGYTVAVWPASTTALGDGSGIEVRGHGPVRVGDQVRASMRGYLGQAPPGDRGAELPSSCGDEGGTTPLIGIQ